MSALRSAKPEEISKLGLKFKDERLNLLLTLYKARNYPKLLSQQEQAQWGKFLQLKLAVSGQADKYFRRLEELSKTPGITGEQKYLLEELNLYAQSIIPTG